MKNWEDWMEKKLIDREYDKQYANVVESPTGIVHILKDESIEIGDYGVTICGLVFTDHGHEEDWELLEGYYFHSNWNYHITCKKCRCLEIIRMKLEIFKEVEGGVINEGITIPADRIIVNFVCIECGFKKSFPLKKAGLSMTFMCDKCNKMESFMEVVDITITE